EDLAHHQRVGMYMTETMDSRGGGASYYAMGVDSTSLAAQIAVAPLAVVTALFRPPPFEANNGLACAASLEALAGACLVVQIVIRTGPRRAFSTLMSTPVLAAALVFAILFGMGVGLATTNFGSLSRYRMPLIPFWATLVLVLARRPTTAKAPAVAP